MTDERGLMALAVGSPAYYRMAKWLFLSVRRHHPDLTIALATDFTDPDLLRLADHVIPVTIPDDGPYALKLQLNELSPFDRTLLMDVDALMVRGVPGIWDFFADVPVGVLGFNLAHGPWYGDIEAMRKQVGAATLPKFNGGLYYHDQSDTARAVFHDARTLMRDYERLDLQRFRGTFADEPVMAMALAKHGVEACFDGDRAFFRTTLNGTVRLDVLRGRCELDKGGTVWRPSIIHFADGSSDPIYLREGRALDLASRGVPDMAARTIARARARTESARA